MPSGFERTASTPSADVNDGLSFELYIVNIMMRTSDMVFFKTNAASAPFKLGIEMSSSTKSGFNSLTFQWLQRHRQPRRKLLFQPDRVRACE